MSEDIYKEIILDHYRNPRNKGNLSNAEISAQDNNPVCGDRLSIDIKLEDNVVSDINSTAKDVQSVSLLHLYSLRCLWVKLSTNCLNLPKMNY